MKLAEEAKEIEVTPEEDRKLRWKIDYCMFPLMCILYAVQFMDKISTSSAAVMGLRTDLKMHGDQYSWVTSAFYFGYLFMNLGPVQFIFQRTSHMSKMLAVFIVIWGMLLALHAAPTVKYPSFIVFESTFRLRRKCCHTLLYHYHCSILEDRGTIHKSINLVWYERSWLHPDQRNCVRCLHSPGFLCY